MLHIFHLTLFPCCTIFVLHSIRVALFSCCTFFMHLLIFRYSFQFSCFLRAKHFSFCTLFVLHSFYISLLLSVFMLFCVSLSSLIFVLHSCPTFFVFQFFHMNFLHVAFFSRSTFFVLHFLYVALFSYCAPFMLKLFHVSLFRVALCSCCFSCCTLFMLHCHK